MQLHHWEPNGVFLKPLIALHEKGAEFTSRWFDPLALEQFGGGFPANVESEQQLEREGPVLVDGARIISSSFFLLEYIAEALPGPDLRPGDAWAHYRMQAWGQRMALLVGPVVSALGCAKYLVPRLAHEGRAAWQARIAQIEPLERRQRWAALFDGSLGPEARSALAASLSGPLQRIEAELAASTWLAGEAYSIADIDAYAMLCALPDLAPELLDAQRTPRMLDFLQRMAERPAVRSARAMTRCGQPEKCWVPGAETSRWG